MEICEQYLAIFDLIFFIGEGIFFFHSLGNLYIYYCGHSNLLAVRHLHCLFTGLSSTNTNDLRQICYKYFAVSNLARVSGLSDSFQGLV